MEKIYRIGKATDNDIHVDFPDIDDYHVVITVRDDKVTIEDLDSESGTFVNGFLIKSTTLKPRDQVKLAGHPLSSLKPFFPGIDLNDYSVEFFALKHVYDDYCTAKEKIIEKSNYRTNLLKFLVVSVPVIVFAFWGRNLGGDYYFPLYIGLNSVLSSMAMFLIKDTKRNKALKELEVNLRKQYKCPKCKSFQLREDWEIHHDQQSCPLCKATWAKPQTPPENEDTIF